MLPAIALIGRPNVGKSTLFNRLTKTHNAIVGDLAGLTRDRQYGTVHFKNHSFIVIDTGGLTDALEHEIESIMQQQSFAAIAEADLILFIVDAKSGLNATDQRIAKELRRIGKPILLTINKIDDSDKLSVMADFSLLGFSDSHAISAINGHNIIPFINKIIYNLDIPTKDDNDSTTEYGIKIAMVGRPNVGKSTLINRILGEERVVVFDKSGTTRDSIYIPFTKDDKQYTLIDTAGVRRRGRINEGVEKFSVVKTLQSIADSNVVIFLIDAIEGLVDHDMNLLGYIVEEGKALVIAVNKWDGLSTDQRNRVKETLSRKLLFAKYADIYFISALHGSGVGLLLKSAHIAYMHATARIPTNKLTNILLDAVKTHQPPMVCSHRIKLRYAHLGGINPPIIIIHGNQTESVPSSYTRYLENYFRDKLEIIGTPIKIEYRGSDNPYKDQKNKLSERQVNKKRRLIANRIKREKKKKDKK